MTERDGRSTSLVVELRPGERLTLSGPAVVDLEAKSGQIARVRVSAARDVKIEKQPQRPAGACQA